MTELNEEQRKAVEFDGRHLLVLAGAGTGKTRTIIARAKHLIRSGVPARRILILSFTRKSAREIVERIKSDSDMIHADGLCGQTFHSWCMGIIKGHPDIFAFHDYTVMDEEDRESCFKLLCGRTFRDADGKKIKPESIAAAYSFAVNTKCSLTNAIRVTVYDNVSPDDSHFQEQAARLLPVFREIILKYRAYKADRRYMDYDDILLVVSAAMKRNGEVRQYIASLYDHILIDEMQDTNPLQYELLSSFYDLCHLFCVGDDAQSIYGFRGADFKTIHRFAEIVPGAEVCKLTLNYRSTQEILDLSNWVLRRSPLAYGKELRSFRGHGARPCMLDWDNEWDEAADITDRIIEGMGRDGYRYGDYMVLARSAWALRKVEAKCISRKIPYVTYGGTGLMQSAHIRDVVAPLRIVSNLRDELAWMRYLKLWKNIGDVTASKIIDRVIGETSISGCIARLRGMSVQPEVAATLENLSGMQSNPSGAISKALETMEKRLSEIYKDSWEWRHKDFPILQDVALEAGSISEFIAEYVLDPKLGETYKTGGKSDDHVVLTTIHSAKGLEAAVCYIVNASTHSYPTTRAILNGEDAIEEERRCLYVALTRAKDRLYIYRDIHSLHVAASDYSDNGRYYFFNNLPEDIVDEHNISTKDGHMREFYHGETVAFDDVLPDFDFS